IHGPDWRSVSKPESALALVDGVAQLLNGGFAATEEGKMRFVRYDAAAAVVDTWKKKDIDDFTVLGTKSHLWNRQKMLFGWRGSNGSSSEEEDVGEYRYEHKRQDATSAANHAYPGQAETWFEDAPIESKWVGVASFLNGSIGAADTTITLNGGHAASFTGARGFLDSSKIFAGLVSSRTAFLKIDDEIIECDTCVKVDHEEEFEPPPPEDFDVDDDGPHAEPVTAGTITVSRVVFTVKAGGRGALGTVAAAHAVDAEVVDVTIPVVLLHELISRYADGIAMLRVTTNLSRFKVQVGDVVALEHDVFARFGASSLSTSVKWQVIGKEVDAHGDQPRITWSLAEVKPVPAIGATGGKWGSKNWPPWMAARLSQLVQSRTVLDNAVQSGAAATAAAGTDITIAKGAVIGGGSFPEVRAQTIPLVDNKDNYIDFDTHSHRLVRHAVANGAAEPALRANEIRLAKVPVVGGVRGSITDKRDLATIKSLDIVKDGTTFAKVLAAALQAGKINLAAGAAGFVNALAKSFVSTVGTWAVGDIPTLPKSKIDPAGTWSVAEIPSLPTSKIDDGAVTEPKQSIPDWLVDRRASITYVGASEHVAWTDVVAYRNGTQYSITNGNTTNGGGPKYVWIDTAVSTTTMQSGDNPPAPSSTVLLIAAPNVTNNGIVTLATRGELVHAKHAEIGEAGRRLRVAGQSSVLQLEAKGSDANVAIELKGKGTGAVKIGRDGSLASFAGAGASFPTTPTSGDFYFRTDHLILYYYDGTNWEPIAPTRRSWTSVRKSGSGLNQSLGTAAVAIYFDVGETSGEIIGPGTWSKVQAGTPTGSVDRFTVNRKGRYLVFASGTFTSVDSGQRPYFSIYRNGSEAVHQQGGYSNVTGGVLNLCMAWLLDCAAGDYIELWAAFNTGTGTFEYAGGGNFNEFKITALHTEDET
ncbi:MAG TPA: hypothetical protein VM600_07980, partial [Actinomycetota bacterium]|nr:hypothetical protein [Actinomycetota bacterium]